MPLHLQLLAAAALLNFLMILVAANISARLYTPAGAVWAAGNRETPLGGEVPPIAGRADRAAKNMSENMILFTPLLLAAHVGGADPATLELGAKIFVAARAAYWVVYLIGVPYLRTMLWVTSLGGMGVIASTVF